MKKHETELDKGVVLYLAHLVEAGKKPSTIGTAKRTMALLEEVLGEKKVISKIMPVHVATFFKGETATMQEGKDGLKPRANASILQIRRIVRDALVWWNAEGYLATVPLPKDERRFLEPRTTKKDATEKAAPVPAPDPATQHGYEQPATEEQAMSEETKAGLKAQTEALNNTLLGSDDAGSEEKVEE